MLPCPCLCNDALLAHALGQQGLPQGVVNLVCPRVIQILALQVDAGVGAISPGEGKQERRKCVD